MRKSLLLTVLLMASAAFAAAQAPTITVQPNNFTVTAPGGAAFTVAATGAAPLAYQWQLSPTGGAPFTDLSNGSGFSGVTTRTLRITPTSGNMTGWQVRCFVVNTTGNATSNTATLTVNVRPSITTQPVAAGAVAGGTATFTVVAAGTAPFSYVWKKNNVAIPGETGATLTLPGVTAASAGSYSVTVSNVAGVVNSRAARLTIGTPPVVTLQPVSRVANAGLGTTFSTRATGTSYITYQWQMAEVTAGAPFIDLVNGNGFSGVTTATLKVGATNTSMTGRKFQCVITNPVGTVTTAIATLSVATRPVVLASPVSRAVPIGGATTFTPTISGTAPLSYQWSRKGVPIPGATGPTYTIPAVTTADAGPYVVRVFNAVGNDASYPALLSVGNIPVITQQPANLGVEAPTNADFSVGVAGSAPFTFQWQQSVDGGTTFTNLTEGNGFSRVTTPKLRVYPTTLAMSGLLLRCKVTNAYAPGGINSAAATLTVGQKPVITVQPAAVGVLAGNPATFSVTFTASDPVTFQWKKDGVNIPGATAFSYTVPSANGSDVGNYTVTVTNPVGTVTSKPAALSLGTPPAVIAPPVDASGVAPKPVKFTITAIGNDPLSYQWQYSTTGPAGPFINLTNDGFVSGATSRTLNITTFPAYDGALFRCVVTNPYGNSTSGTATMTVTSPPNPFVWTARSPASTLPALSTQFLGVAASSNLFVAVGSDTTDPLLPVPLIESSPDGITWTKQTVPANSLGGTQLNSIAWSGAQFAAVGSSIIYTASGSGSTWVNRTTGNILNWTSVTWTGGLFVTVTPTYGTQTSTSGTSIINYINRSPTGAEWTGNSSASATSGIMQAVTSDFGVLVAVGTDTGGALGMVMFGSTTGTGWNARIRGLRSPLYGVGRGLGLYVAVGGSGLLITSPNGTQWNNPPTPTTANLRAVRFVANNFVAVGDAGTLLTSPDGVVWNKRDSGTVENLTGITVIGNLVTVVGTNGTILTGAPTFATSSIKATDTAKGSAVTALATTNGTGFAAVSPPKIDLGPIVPGTGTEGGAGGSAGLLPVSGNGDSTTVAADGSIVQGTVRDASGVPVAEAKVTGTATSSTGDTLSFSTATDSAGHYRVSVPPGEWRVRASTALSSAEATATAGAGLEATADLKFAPGGG